MKFVRAMCFAGALALAGNAAVAQMVNVPKPYNPNGIQGVPPLAPKGAAADLAQLDKLVDKALAAMAKCDKVTFDAIGKQITALVNQLVKRYPRNPNRNGPLAKFGLAGYVQDQEARITKSYGNGGKPAPIGAAERAKRGYPAAGTDLADVLDRVARWNALSNIWKGKGCPKDALNAVDLKAGKKRTAATRAKATVAVPGKAQKAKDKKERDKKAELERMKKGEFDRALGEPAPEGEEKKEKEGGK